MPELQFRVEKLLTEKNGHYYKVNKFLTPLKI